MGIFLASLSFLGYCFFIKRQTRWPIESIPFFVVSAIILIFYFLTYLKCLYLGSLFFIMLGVIFFFLSHLPTSNRLLFTHYFSPGFVIWLICLAVFGFLTQYATFYDPDDFYRWIPQSKFLYFEHHFLRRDDVAINMDYPPGGSLFKYFFLRLNPFSQSIFFYGQLFFFFSPPLILLRNFAWKDWTNALFFSMCFILILMLVFATPLGFKGTGLMDQPVGLFFGGILASYLLMQDVKGLLLYLLIPAAAIVLLRPMVYPFVAISAFLIITDQNYIQKNLPLKRLPVRFYLFLLLVPLLIAFSWQYYLQTARSYQTWSLNDLINSLYHHQTQLDSEHFTYVIAIFLLACAKSFLLVSILLIIAIFIYKRLDNAFLKVRLIRMHGILFFGFLIYLAILLLFYLYQMQPGMALIISSYFRFANTYLLGWLILTLSNFIFLPKKAFNLSPLAINIFKYTTIMSITFFLGWHNFQEFQKQRSARKSGCSLQCYDAVFNQITSKVILKKIPPHSLAGLIATDDLITFSYALLPIYSRSIITRLDAKQQMENQLALYPYLIVYDDGSLRKKFSWLFVATKKQPDVMLNFCSQFDLSHKKPVCIKNNLRQLYLYKISSHMGKVKLINF